MNLILDEFTSLKVSRQRRYQLRRERDGLCRLCGEPVEAPSHYCAKHRAEQAARMTPDGLKRRRRRKLRQLRQSRPVDPRDLI